MLPCQADPTFAAYPYSATRSSGGTPQLAASGESFTSSLAGRAGGCVRPPGANSITSFCSNDSLSDVLNCTVHPLRLESSVLKHPFLQLCFVCQPLFATNSMRQRVRRKCHPPTLAPGSSCLNHVALGRRTPPLSYVCSCLSCLSVSCVGDPSFVLATSARGGRGLASRPWGPG